MLEARIQHSKCYSYLYDSNNNKVLKSEPLPSSGGTAIADAKLRVWAKNHNVEVK